MVLAAGCVGRGRSDRTTPDGEGYYDTRDDRPSPGTTEPSGDSGTRSPPADESRPRLLVRRPASSSGSLEGEAAGAVIFGASEDLARCYAVAGRESSGRGVVYVLLDIEPNGEVGGVLVGHSAVTSSRFMSCIEETLGGLSMPTAPDRSIVQAYMVFGVDDEDEARRLLGGYRARRASSESEEPVPLTTIRQRVQGCFERVARGRGHETGRIVLAITVGEGGAVSTVEVREESFEGRLDSCVIAGVEKLTLVLEEAAGPTILYPVLIQAGQVVAAPPNGAEAPPR